MNWIAPRALSRKRGLLPCGAASLVEWPSAWAMFCLLLAVDLVWALQVGFTIDGCQVITWLCVTLLAVSVAYRGRSHRISNMAEAGALACALPPLASVLTYLGASCAFPLQDITIENLDRIIGFDWLSWHDAVIHRPTVCLFLALVYVSLLPQFAFAYLYFFINEDFRRFVDFLILAGATLIATTLIATIWPALGPFAAHGPTLGPLAATDVNDIGYQIWAPEVRDLMVLRAVGPWHFTLSAMQGIVTMPSYHTVLAVLFTYAFRGTGLIGYGIAILNVLMLLSIPPIGGHYLFDMLVGGALALGAIAIQRAWQFEEKSSPVKHAV